MKNIDINENKIVLKNLQTIRNKRNISQVKLATDIGVSQELISQYELGKSVPNCKTLLLIADYFNCSTDYLLGRTNIEIPIKYLTIDKFDSIKLDIVMKYKALYNKNKQYFDDF